MTRFSLSYLLIFFLLSFSSCTQKHKKENSQAGDSLPITIPDKPIGWVSDFEGVFSSNEINYLDSVIAAYEKETSNEIAIVTSELDSTRIRSTDEFESFALRLFNKWGIGKKDKNNGIGIIICRNLRKVRIETGIGLISKLSDADAKAIIDAAIVPHFKIGEYFKGVSITLDMIMKKIK